MTWFAPRSPVAEDERAWLDESFSWLVVQFGEDVARRPIVEPTRAHFPVPGFVGEANVCAVLDLVADRMAVPATRIALDYVDAQPVGGRRWQHAYRGPAGHYHEHDGTAVITVYGDQTANGTTLVATLAHELGHVRLLGEGRIAEDRRDG